MVKALPSVSIIVPTLNEAGNVATLIARIDAALSAKAIYEIIFIDDHSSDATVRTIKSISKKRTSRLGEVLVHLKRGKRGKAYSLLEGFATARYDYLCMIDADLQYAPEAIPEMLQAALNGLDVIVAERVDVTTSFARRQLSAIGRKVYGKWMFGLDCDVQSGLKLFDRSLIDRFELNSTPWTFDIVFLVQAQQAGYTIGSVQIPFAARTEGESKVNVLSVGAEIFALAIRYKLNRLGA